MAGRYFSDRDISNFEHFNKEIIGNPFSDTTGIINSIVYIYKISTEETKMNMYGEAAGSTGKVYSPGVKLAALVAQDPGEVHTNEWGPDKKVTAAFNFLRASLVEIKFVIDVGDIIDWYDNYWEIQSINESQFVGGQDNKKFAVQTMAFMVRRSQLQIERVRSI